MRLAATCVLFASALASGCAATGSGGSSSAGSDTEGAGSEESGGGDGSPCKAGDSPTLTIGQGETAYLPLEEGGQLELVHGPQGGVHTLMALHAVHIDASEELVGKLQGFLGGELAATSAPYLDMRCNGAEGGLQVWNVRLIWEAPPADLHLQPVTIEAELVDALGVKVTASKDATLHDAMLD